MESPAGNDPAINLRIIMLNSTEKNSAFSDTLLPLAYKTSTFMLQAR